MVSGSIEALAGNSTLPQLTFFNNVWPYERLLYANALRLCGNRDDARDLVQDAFERAWRKFHKLNDETRLQSWLVTILNHLFVDQYRKNRSSNEHLSIDETAAESAAFEHREPEHLEPEWAQFTMDEVRLALQRLKPEFREVYRLHVLGGCSYSDISTKLGLPHSTVGSRIWRARRKLQRLLREQVRSRSQE